MSLYALFAISIVEGLVAVILWDKWRQVQRLGAHLRRASKVDDELPLRLHNEFLDILRKQLDKPKLRYLADRRASLENCTCSPSSFVRGDPQLVRLENGDAKPE